MRDFFLLNKLVSVILVLAFPHRQPKAIGDDSPPLRFSANERFHMNEKRGTFSVLHALGDWNVIDGFSPKQCSAGNARNRHARQAK